MIPLPSTRQPLAMFPAKKDLSGSTLLALGGCISSHFPILTPFKFNFRFTLPHAFLILRCFDQPLESPFQEPHPCLCDISCKTNLHPKPPRCLQKVSSANLTCLFLHPPAMYFPLVSVGVLLASVNRIAN